MTTISKRPEEVLDAATFPFGKEGTRELRLQRVAWERAMAATVSDPHAAAGHARTADDYERLAAEPPTSSEAATNAAMLKFLLGLSTNPDVRRMQVAENQAMLRLWQTGAASGRQVRRLQVLAADLGFWSPETNPAHRPPAGVPGRFYTVGGAGVQTEHGLVEVEALVRSFSSLEEAALAWMAAGQPGSSGNSVWVSENEGVDTLCTVTISHGGRRVAVPHPLDGIGREMAAAVRDEGATPDERIARVVGS